MTAAGGRITRSLTLKYVFALALLAALAIGNSLILRSQILHSHEMGEIVSNSSRQQMLLHRGALLAERLIFAENENDRRRSRNELLAAIEPLEETHYAFMRMENSQLAPPDEVRAIYEDAPWLLDSEMRNYLLHLRSIAEAPVEELHFENAHYSYVRNQATFQRILDGLNAVVAIYQQQNEAMTAHLRLLAVWSLASTLVVLLLDGWFVFRPMVRQVRDDMLKLNELNVSLETRVAERTAEAERRARQVIQSESALRDSEALYRSLVDNLPMCVLRKDCQGRFTFANDSFCRLLGKSLAEIVGRTDADFYSPAMAEKYRRDDRRVMQQQRVVHDTETHRTPGGVELHVEFVKGPLRDAAGEVIGVQTVFWDVTDRKLAEERAIHAERLAAIGQMVAGVAHESRNALQQIQACSQLLQWELDGDALKQELIADLQKAQDRLHRLFDELRGYASPLKLDLRRCDLRDVLIDAWAAIEPLRRGRDVAIHELDDSTAANCRVDPFQFQQVFRNLLENSLAAGPDPLTIEVEYRRSDDRLAMIIRDNGPGLSAEQMQRIFEPFYTTKTQGVGLGMAITRQIVEAHGGAIEARNGETGGAEFIISLPDKADRAARPKFDETTIGEY